MNESCIHSDVIMTWELRQYRTEKRMVETVINVVASEIIVEVSNVFS